MILPGHIALGYLTVKGLTAVLHPELSVVQSQLLVLFGTLSGDFPDIDVAYHFFTQRTTSPEHLGDHRHYITHTPIVWLVAGLAVFFLTTDPLFKMMGLMLWLGPWSHFLGDSIELGVMWLWPFSTRRYAMRRVPGQTAEKGSSSWKDLFRRYSKIYTCYAEIIAVIVAVVVFLL